jgi:galactose mutarotase-like enzyme
VPAGVYLRLMSPDALLGPLTSLETVVLEDASAHARVVIAPARGGMVTRFDVAGKPVLYLDVATLVDETKNVRGGNPVLFPSPGPLAGDRFTRDGRSGSMKQHGFARNRGWKVIATNDKRDAMLELASDDATRAVYPWDFVARLRYALAGTTLTIATTVENRDTTASMPFALGFHPYFHVPDADKARARIPTAATRAYDNVTKTNVDVRGPIDLTAKEVDLHLVDHGSNSATLHRGDDAIVVTGTPDFGRWVVWTLAGKDFVCLEPWTAAADALNTGDKLLVLAPGESKSLTVTVALAPAR